MKKILDFLINSGLLVVPVIFAVAYIYLRITQPQWIADKEHLYLVILGSIAPAFIFWMSSIGRPKEENAWSGKQKAMYPEVDPELLFKKPEGVVLGKDKHTRQYVIKPLGEDGHILVIGGSGSGKSATLVIPTLIANPHARALAVDIKGELSFKSKKIGDPSVIIFDPLNRESWGYDPLYKLNSDSNGQEVYETMQLIAFSLIPLPADTKDPFWKQNARALLLGELLYYYREGCVSFVDLIDKILERPSRETINEAIERANPQSVEYKTLVQFSGLPDETLGGIVAEVNSHLTLFVNDQDIRYAFKNNSNKFNPLMIEEKSIFLSIAEHKLTAYYDVMQLIINQTLAQLELRPENSEPIMVILDELPRILSAGKLDRLLDGLRTLRSRKVSLFLITQSTEALMSAFTESEVDDILSNCPYTVVLDAKSKKTQQAICAWCGKYMVRKQSWNGSGANTKVTISYDEKDIVEPADLMKLRRSGEAIIITPYGYNRVRKVPYYKDRYFKPIADDIRKHNLAIIGLKEEKTDEQESSEDFRSKDRGNRN